MPRTNQLLQLTWFNKDKALIPTEHGKYGYSWVDARDPRYCETHTLVEGEYIEGVQAEKEDDLSYSKLADLEPTTDNLLINGESGNVLEALTRVPELADKYLGKIKLCYIDPPFNTAEAFTHADYEDNLEHSVWLTMMRDRLVHIKKLLTDAGSIWVHLDDGENHRMRVLLDEVFGAGNFMAEVVWQKADSPRRGDGFSDDHDIILVYRKSSHHRVHHMLRTAADNARFTNPDNDPNGPWWDDNPTANHGDGSGGMCYAIQNPLTGAMMRPPKGGSWRYSQARIFEALNQWVPYRYENLQDKEWRAQNEGVPVSKASDDVCALVLDVPLAEAVARVHARRQQEDLPEILIRSTGGLGRKAYIPATGTNPRTWWSNAEVGHNRAAKSEIKALFPDINAFSTPKPERLLERIIHIATDPGDIVLDVFAGSGTTAAVAHKMRRRWVTAELLPETVEKFTLPRLTKVVRGEDPGGITSIEGERVDATEDGLPGDLSAAEAFALTQALGKIAKVVSAPVDLAKVVGDAVLADSKTDDPALDNDEAKTLRRLMRKLAGAEALETDFLPYVKKSVGGQLKTKKSPNMINCRGGGGFRVAHLSPACFDYNPDLGLVTLTEAAFEGDNLARAVAAHLNFHLTPENRTFTGKRGRTRLVVTTAAATPEYVNELVPHLDYDEKLVLASTSVDPDAQQTLRKACQGSRVVHIPNDLFRVHEIEG
ncbi:site-specific DNA-methyltransferase [Rhodococcus erythropolis]|uniref:site-specific DNA-methyltransferase n=1 Tax=Rhodococcus erythropolis TaxID=1833 RepID=UPI0002E47E15|nr:site-specific DNA-methyltransferase [Rhodococcus erythropolis]